MRLVNQFVSSFSSLVSLVKFSFQFTLVQLVSQLVSQSVSQLVGELLWLVRCLVGLVSWFRLSLLRVFWSAILAYVIVVGLGWFGLVQFVRQLFGWLVCLVQSSSVSQSVGQLVPFVCSLVSCICSRLVRSVIQLRMFIQISQLLSWLVICFARSSVQFDRSFSQFVSLVQLVDSRVSQFSSFASLFSSPVQFSLAGSVVGSLVRSLAVQFVSLVSQLVGGLASQLVQLFRLVSLVRSLFSWFTFVLFCCVLVSQLASQLVGELVGWLVGLVSQIVSLVNWLVQFVSQLVYTQTRLQEICFFGRAPRSISYSGRNFGAPHSKRIRTPNRGPEI